MHLPLNLRVMTDSDLPFADNVRRMAGWNQTLTDWHRFLAMEPDGCFLAEWDGTPVGTATTIAYGSDLAWIGMVLVHPDYRRRGIGKALLERCLAYLQEKSVSCIKLDATPLGKAVYDNLGFRDEWTLTRWENPNVDCNMHQELPGCRCIQPTDLEAIERIDSAAFGASRLKILKALIAQSSHEVVFENRSGQIDGYGLVRPGSRAFYLGPVAAVSIEAALQVVESLLAHCAGHPVFWDIPDHNEVIIVWAKQHGFSAQRQLIRMHLGDNRMPGLPSRQIALTGPETG
jgi:ribosomal protein S18 acetylase RimI-like enzyme